jgi:serine-type D-Ala-D-Ala carboxypeptidase (penicillin-binding protein 5/6)
MRVRTGRRGRLLPLLLFVVVLVVLGAVLAGVALGTSTTTTPAGPTPAGTALQTQSVRLSASQLGDFGGDPPTIKSPSAVVESMDTGKVLYERNAHTRRAMASTTKIMTAILVFESGVDLSTPVTVSAKAASTWEPSAWVTAGDVLTVEQLLYALLLRSANGAAVALAENDAGSVSAFVEKMNQKAAELGMNDTHFVTVNGLDSSEHYSTAADMAVVGRYAMKNERFREFVDTKKYTLSIEGEDPLMLTNTNKLLQQYNWVNGVKTGSTPNAEHCLVSSGTQDGREVIAVVLGQPDTDLCFQESKALLQYGLDQFRQVSLVQKGLAVAEATVPYQEEGTVQLVTDGALDAELTSDDVVTTQVNIERPLTLPITAGDTYGHVVVSAGDKEVGRVDLVATKSFQAPTLGLKLAYYWHRLGAKLGIG